jgi:hypothetical protein
MSVFEQSAHENVRRIKQQLWINPYSFKPAYQSFAITGDNLKLQAIFMLNLNPVVHLYIYLLAPQTGIF